MKAIARTAGTKLHLHLVSDARPGSHELAMDAACLFGVWAIKQDRAAFKIVSNNFGEVRLSITGATPELRRQIYAWFLDRLNDWHMTGRFA